MIQLCCFPLTRLYVNEARGNPATCKKINFCVCSLRNNFFTTDGNKGRYSCSRCINNSFLFRSRGVWRLKQSAVKNAIFRMRFNSDADKSCDHFSLHFILLENAERFDEFSPNYSQLIIIPQYSTMRWQRPGFAWDQNARMKLTCKCTFFTFFLVFNEDKINQAVD